MKPSNLIAAIACSLSLAACGGGGDLAGEPASDALPAATATTTGPASGPAGDAAATTAERADVLAKSGVPMPGADASAIEPSLAAEAAAAAAAMPGSRGPFQDFHDSVSPLRPVSSLRLAALAPTEVVCLGVDGAAAGACPDAGVAPPPPLPPGDPAACPRVCSTACASATATAAAAAFAHASVQACAFAQAWACVYERTPPFDRVCAWARSQACASAFASAFGFGFAVSNDQECRTVCSDGTVTVTNGPPPAAKSLLRPNT